MFGRSQRLLTNQLTNQPRKYTSRSFSLLSYSYFTQDLSDADTVTNSINFLVFFTFTQQSTPMTFAITLGKTRKSSYLTPKIASNQQYNYKRICPKSSSKRGHHHIHHWYLTEDCVISANIMIQSYYIILLYYFFNSIL